MTDSSRSSPRTLSGACTREFLCVYTFLCDDDAHDAYQRGLEIYLQRLDKVDPLSAGRWLRTVDTRGLPDGTSDVRLVVRDAAGNEAENIVQLRIDNTAPAAPDVVTAADWSSARSATWSWGASAEADRAPVVGGDVEVCGATGCATEGIAAGVQSLTKDVGEGSTTVRVRLRDEAGNVGEWSAKSPALRDWTAPTSSLSVPGETVQAGHAFEAQVQAHDGLSGIAAIEKELRVGSGAWRSWDGPEQFPEGSTVEFRARAVDRAGNQGAWAVSQPVRVATSAFVAPTPTPAATATPSPTPAPKIRTASRLTGLTARYAKGRLVVRGRLTARNATGVVRVLRARARVEKGRFTLRARVRRPPKRLTVRYGGDLKYLPTRRNVAVRRGRQA